MNMPETRNWISRSSEEKIVWIQNRRISSVTDYAEIMQKSYIDYALSVIISRALPDVRDGTETGTEKNFIRYV